MNRRTQEWDVNQTLPLFFLANDLMYVYGGDRDSRHFLVPDFCEQLASRHPRLRALLCDAVPRERTGSRLARLDTALGLGAGFRPDAVVADRSGLVSIVESKMAPLSAPEARDAVSQAIKYADHLARFGQNGQLEFLDLLHHIHWWSSGLHFRHQSYREGGFTAQHQWHFCLPYPVRPEAFLRRPAIRMLLIVDEPTDRATNSLREAIKEHPTQSIAVDVLDLSQARRVLRTDG